MLFFISPHYIPMLHRFDADGQVFNVVEFKSDRHSSPDLFYTLAEIKNISEGEIPIKVIGWLWRRILGGLIFPHHEGFINCGITPDSIWIDPASHSVVLMDWYNASKHQDQPRLIVPKWRLMYPPEILAKDLPTPATDICMAAKVMLWAFPGMPPEMKLYFSVLAQDSVRARISDIDLLLKEWDRVMYDRLNWKREFVPFEFNPQINWEWWW